jgi:hypothetical protein
MENEGASDALEPEKRGRGVCMTVCYDGGEVAAAEPWGGMAYAREGQGGGARAVAGVQLTRGVCPSRRWRRGEAGAAMSGSDDRRQRSRGAEEVPEEGEEGKGSEGLVCKNRKIQGPHYKLKFPTDPKA